MKFEILTLFPEMFAGFLGDSILGRAQKNGIFQIETTNIRDFSTNAFQKVDDTIYGGGAGLLLSPEPVASAIRSAKAKSPNAHVVFLSPSGAKFDQRMAEKMAEKKQDIILLCGRYEGVDARIREALVDEEISIGDFVMTGGEIGAAAIVDAVARLLPEVVGKSESVEEESFSRKIFRCGEFPQFTRPAEWEGMPVPQVLRSGNAAEIENWRFSQIPHLGLLEQKMLLQRRKKLPQKSKNLIFRMPEERDIDLWMNWVNDPEVTAQLILDPPFTREDEEDFFEMAITDLTQIVLSVDDKKTKKPIGITHLQTFPLNPFSAEFGILIGEKEFWGRGIGTEITRQMEKIAFQDLGLRKIVARVFAENTASQKIFRKLGFREIGIFEKEVQKSDGFHDCLFFEKLAHEAKI